MMITAYPCPWMGRFLLTLAIGQTQDDLSDALTGRIELFEYSSLFGWSGFGKPIELVGDQFAANFGFSISLNEDGTVIAVGDPGTSLPGTHLCLSLFK